MYISVQKTVLCGGFCEAGHRLTSTWMIDGKIYFYSEVNRRDNKHSCRDNTSDDVLNDFKLMLVLFIHINIVHVNISDIANIKY